MDPVAQSALDRRRIGPRWPIDVTSQVVGFAASDVAESPIVNAVHQFDEGRTIANLESHIQTKFVLRAFANFDDLEGARNINSDRLLEINMLPCSDDCLQVMGMVVGWSRDHDRIDFLRGGDPVVRIRTDKKLRGVQCRVAFSLLHFVEVLAGGVELVLEQVTQRNHACAARVHKIGRVLGPAATATQ